VKAYVYQPPKQRVKGCGEVLGELPIPGDPDAGPLHRLPKISWLNWVRLALIPAGGDWRDLPKRLEPAPANPDKHRNKFAVTEWKEAAPTITGATRPGSGGPSVADPRLAIDAKHEPFANTNRFTGWDKPVGTVTASPAPSSGRAAVADPRIGLGRTADEAASYGGRPGLFGVNAWEEPLKTVTGTMKVSGSNAVAAVADPRTGLEHEPWRGALGVIEWEQPAPTVRGASSIRQSRSAVADPRLGVAPRRRGTFGVLGWAAISRTTIS
jgi:hypothetical protein